MKTVGALLWVTALAGAGQLFRQNLIQKRRQSELFCDLISEIRELIRLEALPISSIIDVLSRDPKWNDLLLFASLPVGERSDIYLGRRLNAVQEKLSVSEQACAVLQSFFRKLGMGDLETQLTLCTKYEEKLRSVLTRELAAEEREIHMLCRVLPLCGALIALLIL